MLVASFSDILKCQFLSKRLREIGVGDQTKSGFMQPLNEKFALPNKDETYPELLELPGEAGEVELPDGPGEPVADVLLGPGLGVPRHL